MFMQGCIFHLRALQKRRHTESIKLNTAAMLEASIGGSLSDSTYKLWSWRYVISIGHYVRLCIMEDQKRKLSCVQLE